MVLTMDLVPKECCEEVLCINSRDAQTAEVYRAPILRGMLKSEKGQNHTMSSLGLLGTLSTLAYLCISLPVSLSWLCVSCRAESGFLYLHLPTGYNRLGTEMGPGDEITPVSTHYCPKGPTAAAYITVVVDLLLF